MSEEPPTPPASLPAEVTETLEELTAERLRELSAYADALAEHTDRETPDETADRAGETERPAGVPAKATVTTKEINGNRYDYWQWRDGEKVRSAYKGPATDGTEG